MSRDPGVGYVDSKSYLTEKLAKEAEDCWRAQGRRVKRIKNKLYLW
jgi:hypothetical protein